MIQRNGRSLALAGAACLFIAGGIRAQAPSATVAAATVNGEAIPLAEVDSVLKLVPPQPATITDEQRRQMRHDALEMLIDDCLIRQFLAKNGRPVEPQEIDRQLAELQTALTAQKRSLHDFLIETAQSEAHLRQDVRKKLQWDDWVSRQISEDSLRRYYEEFKDYYDQVTVRASHILIRVPPNAGEPECQQARNKLADLRQKIVSGRLDFADAAKKYSHCTSAPQGGDIGYFSRKWAVDERLAAAAFALRVGDISDVIRSDMGFHLVKVTDRKPGTPSTFEKAHDAVRQNYAMELWQNVIANQRKDARIDVRMP